MYFFSWFQNDRCVFVPLESNDDSHAFTRRLVADIRNTFDFFIANKIGHRFDELRFVHLVRKFRDDNFFAVFLRDDLADRLKVDDAGAFFVRRNNTFASADDTGGREVRPRDVHHEIIDCRIRIFNQVDAAGDHFQSNCAAECSSPCRRRYLSNR